MPYEHAACVDGAFRYKPGTRYAGRRRRNDNVWASRGVYFAKDIGFQLDAFWRILFRKRGHMLEWEG